MLDAVYQSLVIFFVAEGAYAGSDVDIWEFGTTITTSVIKFATLNLSSRTKKVININFYGTKFLVPVDDVIPLCHSN